MGKLPLLVLADPSIREVERLSVLADLCTIVVSLDEAEIARKMPEPEIVLLWDWECRTWLFPSILKRASSRLRWVHIRFAGVDELLAPELLNSKITVTNAAGNYARPLAEFIIGAIFYFAKEFPRLVGQQRRRQWKEFWSGEVGGKTLGIFGYGGIGRATAERAAALGMRIIGCRRQAAETEPPLSALYPVSERLELFRRSDYLAVTAALTSETEGIIGEAELRALPATAVLINVARGAIVSETALLDALRSGRLRGAALDVFDREPLSLAHPFWTMENVLISPHSACFTRGVFAEAMDFFILNARRYAASQPLLNIVDKSRGY